MWVSRFLLCFVVFFCCPKTGMCCGASLASRQSSTLHVYGTNDGSEVNRQLYTKPTLAVYRGVVAFTETMTASTYSADLVPDTAVAGQPTTTVFCFRDEFRSPTIDVRCRAAENSVREGEGCARWRWLIKLFGAPNFAFLSSCSLSPWFSSCFFCVRFGCVYVCFFGCVSVLFYLGFRVLLDAEAAFSKKTSDYGRRCCVSDCYCSRSLTYSVVNFE